MFKYDEQIIADFIRVLYRNKVITYKQLDEIINVLQIRLFASEKNMTVDELIDHLGLSGKVKQKKNQRSIQTLQSPAPRLKP